MKRRTQLADYMKKSHTYIITVLIGSLVLTYGLNKAELEGTLDTNPHFWVVTTESTNNAIGPLLDRYIQDVTPILNRQYRNITIEKKLVDLDTNQSPNKQTYSVAATLENGYHNSNLKGVLLVDIPLPAVTNKGTSQVSLLPYGDFENKYFVFDANTETYVSQDAVVRENIQPEIMVGYLPDLTPVGFQGYFEANHNYYTQASAYNRAVFFNDQIHDDQLWNTLGTAIHSPIDTVAFDPQSYTNAIKASEKTWKDALRSTRRWQSLPSLSSSQVKAYFDSWYEEPVLNTMSNILPTVASYFLDLPNTQDTAQLSEQENSMGAFLNQLGVISSTIAINHRLFATYPAARNTDNVCNTINPLPTNDNPEVVQIHNQVNTLKAWISSVPRGSLLAKSDQPNTITVNGALVGQYFLIRPGALVRTVSNEPATVKTILVDPSRVTADLTIPRNGFNHPGLVEGADSSWTTNSIGDEQVKELIGWHYFLNPQDQYLYFAKNRLPALNQFASLPDTYEIVYNNIDQSISQDLTGACLNNRSPETKSILTIFSGHVSLVDHNNNLPVWQELRSGASLASLVISGSTVSQNHSFDDSNTHFTGLQDPPYFSSWASGSMLGQAVLTGLNENVNLVGDPCLMLLP